MSHFLREEHPVIGVTRNTFMLACQNATIAPQLLTPESIRTMGHRAAFQVLDVGFQWLVLVFNVFSPVLRGFSTSSLKIHEQKPTALCLSSVHFLVD